MEQSKDTSINITDEDLITCSCGSQLHVPVYAYIKAKTMIIGQEAMGRQLSALYCISCGKLTSLNDIKAKREEIKLTDGGK